MSYRITVDPTDPNGNNIAATVQTHEARVKRYQEQAEERRATATRIREALAEREAEAAKRQEVGEKAKRQRQHDQLVANLKAEFFESHPAALESDWLDSCQAIIAQALRAGRDPAREKMLAIGHYDF